jgi:hypothetical protein
MAGRAAGVGEERVVEGDGRIGYFEREGGGAGLEGIVKEDVSLLFNLACIQPQICSKRRQARADSTSSVSPLAVPSSQADTTSNDPQPTPYRTIHPPHLPVPHRPSLFDIGRVRHSRRRRVYLRFSSRSGTYSLSLPSSFFNPT